MGCNWEKVPLGSSGLSSSPLGIASSFGVGGTDLERAFEHGINYFYWGSIRRSGFGQGLRAIAKNNREKMIVVVQSYNRIASLIGPSLDLALWRLNFDYADFLLLGWWNEEPPKRILDVALELKRKGKARHLMISCHNRKAFKGFVESGHYDAIMLRYNAAHPGAEQDIFPYLPPQKPGVISYTATRWGHLIDPKRLPKGEKHPSAADCYRFVLTNPNVDVCMAGPQNGSQLDQALTALDKGPMQQEELDWMRRMGNAVKNGFSVFGSGA